MLIRYEVMTAAVKPLGGWGSYARIVVVEIDLDLPRPKIISMRARALRSIVREWSPVYVGTTERCAYQRALRSARELAAALNVRAMGEI